MSSAVEVWLVCSSLWQELLFRKIGELHHFTTFHYSFKCLSKVFLRCVSPSFSIFSLSKQDGVETVVKFGRLNIMERPQNFLQCYRKVLCCNWN